MEALCSIMISCFLVCLGFLTKSMLLKVKYISSGIREENDLPGLELSKYREKTIKDRRNFQTLRWNLKLTYRPLSSQHQGMCGVGRG